jgi:hypothetical protein
LFARLRRFGQRTTFRLAVFSPVNRETKEWWEMVCEQARNEQAPATPAEFPTDTTILGEKQELIEDMP